MTLPKFATRKWIKVNVLSGGKYSTNNLRFKTPMGRFDLSDTYIVTKGEIRHLAAAAANENDKAVKKC